MSLLLPALVGLLKPTQGMGTLHETSVQVILKLATTAPDFKNQVLMLTDSERQSLENSLRLHYAAQNQAQTQRVESSVKTATPLKLDFTKYQ